MGATKPGAALWSGSIVPFEIDPNFDEPSRVSVAIQHWEAQTNIRFVRRGTQSDFVIFRNGQECSSPVGRQGGAQNILCKPVAQTPSSQAAVTVVVHEIGHMLGLIHEHQRSDRDTFVEIHEENIEPGKEHNFDRITNSINLTDYDIDSVMHYTRFLFSTDGPTVVPLGSNAEPGNATGLTPTDVVAVRQMGYDNVGIVRRSDSGKDAAGRVGEIAVVNGSNGFDLVTAVRTAQGNLRLIRWEVNDLGGVRRLADLANQAGEASSISIARGERFVTAVRTDEGTLKLISWSVGGDIRRLKDSGDAAGGASAIRIIALTNTLFVTACRDSSGDLVLITWRLNTDGSFRRLGDSHGQAGDVSEISLVRVRQVGANNHIATTVRAAGGRVKTITWNVSPNGVVSRRGDSANLIGEGSLIESVMHPSTGLLIVSCRTDEGRLKLIALSVSNATQISRRGDSGNAVGAIRRNALMAGRGSRLVSAVQTGERRLKLIGWSVSANGSSIVRAGDSGDDPTGQVGLVRLADDTRRANAPLVTCVQTADEDLRLITWDDQPEHGEIGLTLLTASTLQPRASCKPAARTRTSAKLGCLSRRPSGGRPSLHLPVREPRVAFATLRVHSLERRCSR